MRRMRESFIFSALLSFLFFSLIMSPPLRARAASSTVVISEFRTRGPNGANDELIELYNLSSSSVNIGGWLVKGSNGSGTASTRAIINGGTILSPGCHYLLANSNPTGGPYSGAITPNQTYGVGITDDGGIALTRPDGTIIDQVGMSSGSAFKEGSPLAPMTGTANQSYERRPGGSSGSTQDTDNNQTDFRLIPSAPQNISSSCATGQPSPTNPIGTGMADPGMVNRGNSTLLTVSVTPGQNPTSSGLTVTGDLSSINGNAAQAFFDDGTHGDGTPGDNIFSFRAEVSVDAPLGLKSLLLTITDAQGRMGNSSVTLTVQDQGAAQCGVERWAVKTGTDADASMVSVNSLAPTTITLLRALQRPSSLPDNNRVAPVETTVYVLNATLTQYKLEDDSDYHLVLRDDAGNTIIVEIPCPCCVGAASPFAARITAARNQFDARFTATDSFQTANIPVRVVGVGFFDFAHGQTGAAPNQIELHPVLDVQFDVSIHAPHIVGATVVGKKLFISGLNFDEGAKLYINDEKQKTVNDDASPSMQLVCKKAGKNIGAGQTVTLIVRNSDGTPSDPFSFTKP